MSATRTFSVLKSFDYAAGDKWGYQTAEKVRQATDQAAYAGLCLDLGGSEVIGVVGTSYETVPMYREHTIDGSSLGGLTLEAVIFTKTGASGTSVQAKIRNTTDSTDAGVGTSGVSLTVVSEVVALTMPSGPKVYRLEVIGGNLNAPVSAWGYLRLRKVPI